MNYKESETLELKKSTSELDEAINSIVAILNKHNSGEVIFGINSKGEVIGQDISEKTLRDISQKIANSIEPRIYPEIKQIKINNRDCIIIKFTGNEPMYYAYGRAYVRTADEDRLMSAKEIEKRIQQKSKLKWDSLETTETLESISKESVNNYLKKANISKRINYNFTSLKEVLDKLNLMKNDSLTNASIVLFSKNKPIEVQLAVFAGTTKTTFLDIRQYEDNIIKLLESCESYIKERINWRADLSGSKRVEIPEIPIRALKEALVNSFCHRDYTAPESNKIAIYRDRVEIWNPGNFPEGYKPIDFVKKELPSVLRNPLIANILFLSEDVEKWGSGLRRIYEECKSSGVKVKFDVLKYGFSVVFYRSKTESNSIEEINTNPAQIRHKSGTNPAQIRQKWILEYLNKNKEIKNFIITKEFSINRDTALSDLKDLIKQGKIIKKGAGSNVWYELK
jgi:ATP-dependent DNA helicase RecG